jgi:hypothetical protein
MFTNEQAAKWFGVGLTSFFKHIRPALPAVRIGRSVRFDLVDMVRAKERLKAAETPAPVQHADPTPIGWPEGKPLPSRSTSRSKTPTTTHERRLRRLLEMK